ncbi:hypothetical protein CR513_26741, partial [Mucuna pruriens]
SLWERSFKDYSLHLNKVPTKVVKETSYELWISKKSSCSTEARPYRPHERKLNSRTVSCYFVGYVELSWGYKFYNPTSTSFFETGNTRILEEVELRRKRT